MNLSFYFKTEGQTQKWQKLHDLQFIKIVLPEIGEASKMLRTLAFSALIFCQLQGLTFGADKKPKVVSTLLNAKWSRTPFVLEASEFLASENSDTFWSFVDYFAEPDNVDIEERLTQEELYQRVITFCSR